MRNRNVWILNLILMTALLGCSEKRVPVVELPNAQGQTPGNLQASGGVPESSDQARTDDLTYRVPLGERLRDIRISGDFQQITLGSIRDRISSQIKSPVVVDPLLEEFIEVSVSGEDRPVADLLNDLVVAIHDEFERTFPEEDNFFDWSVVGGRVLVGEASWLTEETEEFEEFSNRPDHPTAAQLEILSKLEKVLCLNFPEDSVLYKDLIEFVSIILEVPIVVADEEFEENELEVLNVRDALVGYYSAVDLLYLALKDTYVKLEVTDTEIRIVNN